MLKIGKRAKALIVGALPLPCEGPWVYVGDRDHWRVCVDGCHPEGRIAIDVKPLGRIILNDGNGAVVSFGEMVRAVILEEFQAKSVSIILEEV